MTGRLGRLTFIFVRCLYKGDMYRAMKIHAEIGKILRTYKNAC